MITLRNILVANVINVVFSLVTSKVIEENPVVLTSLSIHLLITKSYKIFFTKIYFCRNGKLFLNNYSMTNIVGWTITSFPIILCNENSKYETLDDTCFNRGTKRLR